MFLEDYRGRCCPARVHTWTWLITTDEPQSLTWCCFIGSSPGSPCPFHSPFLSPSSRSGDGTSLLEGGVSINCLELSGQRFVYSPLCLYQCGLMEIYFMPHLCLICLRWPQLWPSGAPAESSCLPVTQIHYGGSIHVHLHALCLLPRVSLSSKERSCSFLEVIWVRHLVICLVLCHFSLIIICSFLSSLRTIRHFLKHPIYLPLEAS